MALSGVLSFPFSTSRDFPSLVPSYLAVVKGRGYNQQEGSITVNSGGRVLGGIH